MWTQTCYAVLYPSLNYEYLVWKITHAFMYIFMTHSVFRPPPWNIKASLTKDHHMCSPEMVYFCSWILKSKWTIQLYNTWPYIVDVNTHILQTQRRNFTCHTPWVWVHPNHQRGNLTWCMLWAWGHPYLSRRQNRFLTCHMSYMWQHHSFETSLKEDLYGRIHVVWGGVFAII